MKNQSQVRLLPSAATIWAAMFAVFEARYHDHSYLLIIVVGFFILFILGIVLSRIDRGQAILTSGSGSIALFIATLRLKQAESFSFSSPTLMRALDSARVGGSGAVQHFSPPGYPGSITVFSPRPLNIIPGELAMVKGYPDYGRGLGLDALIFHALEAVRASPVHPVLSFRHELRLIFRHHAEEIIDGDAGALVPAMVFGDISGQSPQLRQDFILSGLAHLSAVSGANITMILTAVVVLFARCSPRMRAFGALLVMAAYIFVVGMEASVLRAGFMGAVGMIALVTAAVRAPMNALAISSGILLLYHPGFATHWGFALSVGATSGIIVINPWIYWHLRHMPGPAIIWKSLSVALAAQLSTMPLVAGMAGHISVVSIFANLICAPAVPVVTIFGLIAAGCVGLGELVSPLAHIGDFILWVLAPVARWIISTAHIAAHLNGAVITVASPVKWAIVIALWALYAISKSRTWWVLALAALVLGVLSLPQHELPEPDLSTIRTYEVNSLQELTDQHTIPAGTEAIIVRSHKDVSADYPTVTQTGIPVYFRAPDGYSQLESSP
ncbi:ComEC/Rec2 family competence protein [Corynebacterium sp. ES2794-CONJ1]|uniref:ComEC/Rec2 family competence protein n=1 Tax=Corynebacterium sp. ES2794-CONJ1 TaxID=2980553 RepID=UPI0021DB0404|nr:ComEC/Rec2 family competence protein [Corynebacterium sp. ES2794-CONJ1]MCU9519904.1 ComEC/Rec2 family competence protein [Corynebacterium sp. ES2794-CONJ1]